MKICKGVTRQQFRNDFGTTDQCLRYLSDQKWGEGYTCRKSGSGAFTHTATGNICTDTLTSTFIGSTD